MAYDSLGRKIAMCDPNMGTAVNVGSCTTATVGAWVYTYSPAGDLLTQTDAKNQTLTFTYDPIGRPAAKKQGATTLVQWTYDTSSISPPPTGGDYPIGRLTQVYQPPTDTTTRFAYNNVGDTIQSNRQLLGVWYTMSQHYDALHRIDTETFNDGETVTYNYEGDWVKSITSSNSGNYITDIQYNARGQKSDQNGFPAITYGNGVVSHFTYDPNNFRVMTHTTSNNLQSLSYQYDSVGNVTSIQDNLGGGTAWRNFQYDDLNRLTYAEGAFGTNQSFTNCTYGYDPIGNITNKCGVTFTYGDPMHPSAVTYNPATNKNYSYDANGNMITRGTQTLTWDADNRVSSVSIQGGGTTSMEYDYSGVRLKKDAPTGTTLYPFSGVEIDPNGVMTKYIRIGVETLASKKGTQQLFYHNDHLGSVNVITDINGTEVQRNEYDPWGSVSKSTGNIDPTHRFTGKELDPETGLYYYGGRYYDPEISRFISPDPFVPQPDNPQSLNRYSYVLNNPQRYIDPSGFSFWSTLFGFFKKIIGYVVAAVVTAVTGNPMLGGLVGGLVNAAVNGKSLWQGALIGAITGGLMGGAGGGQGNDFWTPMLLASAAGVTASDFASRLKGSFALRTLANQNGYIQLGGAVPRGGTTASSYTDAGSWWGRYPFAGCDDCSPGDVLASFLRMIGTSVAEAAEKSQKRKDPNPKLEQGNPPWAGPRPRIGEDLDLEDILSMDWACAQRYGPGTGGIGSGVCSGGRYYPFAKPPSLGPTISPGPNDPSENPFYFREER